MGVAGLLIICAAQKFNKSGTGARVVAVFWTVIWGLLMVGHQSYVEFFHHNIMPFHMRYLIDAQFLAANSSSAVNLRGILILSVTLIAGWWVFLSPSSDVKTQDKGLRRVATDWAIILTVAVALHAVNIRWRVNWFIPNALQVNFIEKFFIDLRIARVPPTLTPEELRMLGQDLHAPTDGIRTMDRATLETLLLSDTNAAAPESMALHSAFESLKAKGEKPIVAVVLMETLRASESGFMNPGTMSLTPNLDTLAQTGIFFENASSTGTVTRSGQEAVWCGYLSGQDSSMMRGRPDVRVPCLPKLASGNNKALSLWLHGGDGRFDGQRQFWLEQGVDEVMSLEEFPPDAPRTGWGIGDITWAEAAVQKLKADRNVTDATWILAMLLTVTNHIPWDLPDDAPAHIKDITRFGGHRKYATTMYSDAALGRMIDGLKKEGLWDKTLLFVTGDHGNLERPWVAPDGEGEAVAGRLLSHVPLVVSGGLTEKLRELSPTISGRVSRHVSIAGIAPTIASIAGIEGRWLSRDVFSPLQPTIWVDLGHALFVPGSSEKIDRVHLMQRHDERADSREKRSAVLHYRALSHLLNEWGLRQDR